jgi:hypothetical protein
MRDGFSGTVQFQITCYVAPSTLRHIAEGGEPI